MIPAILHGKLSSEQENMEDILTSNVFGLLKHLPPESGLFPFLALSEDLKGDHPLGRILSSDEIGEDVHVEYIFWPWMKEEDCTGAEPDVQIEIRMPNRHLSIIIEAKYHSPKSSAADDSVEPPTDQLAKQWDNLRVTAKKNGATPYLIYLTAGFGRPEEEIRASLDEYRKKRPEYDPMSVLWLSWRRLNTVLDHDTSIGLDLLDLLAQLNLIYFQGFGTFENISFPKWMFTGVKPKAEDAIDWSLFKQSHNITWRYII